MELSRRVLRIVTLVSAICLLAECSGDSITRPELVRKKAPVLSIFTCTATPATQSLSCAETGDPLQPNYSMSTGSLSGESRNAILIGNQHVNVDIITSNITNDTSANHFAFDVSIKNLRPQPIGTVNGTVPDSSISIFFHQGPTTTLGSGSVSVFNPTGVATFTAPAQPYFRYTEMLPQNATSGVKNWILSYAETVQTFTFQLLVSANVPHPDGYIDVYSPADSVSVGATLQMTDTVRNALGYPTADQSRTWSLSDSTKASINSSGLLTGSSVGSVTVTATQGLKTGSRIIKVIASDGDNDGFTIAQGDCNDSDASVHPGASDSPDNNFVDKDCDGIDGSKAFSVFVSKTGTDAAGCGDYAQPCLTIAMGLSRATALSRFNVLIGVGTYTEAVVLVNGVNMWGGYSSDFTVRSMANRATINGSASFLAGELSYAVAAQSITALTTFDMLIVVGPSPTGQVSNGYGKHSVGMFISASTSAFTISSTRIVAGNGTAGSDGAAGTDATQTAPSAGSNGGDGNELTVNCDNTSKGLGGAGAGSGASKGGKGGDGGTMDTDCSFFLSDFNATPGAKGDNAATFGVTFGNGGLGGSGTDVCGPTEPGQNGKQTDGASGGGGASGTSGVSPNIFEMLNGSDGSLGEDGTGGGGGGGGGGCDQGTDAWGGGGGGGGSGGARAPVAGTGGHGGGASIGIYLRQASPILLNDSITRGNGGTGGAGGAGAKGQPGSIGGQGGAHPGSAAPGKGGDGAAGGYAGAGGGGAGGLSTGVLKQGTSSPLMSNVIVTGGTGGNGGAGGARGDGTSGGAGTNGSVTDSISIS